MHLEVIFLLSFAALSIYITRQKASAVDFFTAYNNSDVLGLSRCLEKYVPVDVVNSCALDAFLTKKPVEVLDKVLTHRSSWATYSFFHEILAKGDAEVILLYLKMLKEHPRVLKASYERYLMQFDFADHSSNWKDAYATFVTNLHVARSDVVDMPFNMLHNLRSQFNGEEVQVSKIRKLLSMTRYQRDRHLVIARGLKDDDLIRLFTNESYDESFEECAKWYTEVCDNFEISEPCRPTPQDGIWYEAYLYTARNPQIRESIPSSADKLVYLQVAIKQNDAAFIFLLFENFPALFERLSEVEVEEGSMAYLAIRTYPMVREALNELIDFYRYKSCLDIPRQDLEQLVMDAENPESRLDFNMRRPYMFSK